MRPLVARLLRAALPVLLVVAGLALVLAPPILRVRDLPWYLPEIIAVLGALIGWRAWQRNRTAGRLAVASLATLLVGGHLYWLTVLSRYGPPAQPVALGARVELEAVRVRDGARFRLGAQRGRGTLLVVFRGGW